jgi:hypothetical protein
MPECVPAFVPSHANLNEESRQGAAQAPCEISLKHIPEVLVINFVVVLHFGRLHERAQ